jgi:hypothetical protein
LISIKKKIIIKRIEKVVEACGIETISCANLHQISRQLVGVKFI